MTIPIVKGIVIEKGSHFFLLLCIHIINIVDMDTVNYQTKAQIFLVYLSEQNYSARYVSLLKKECERAVGYLSSFGSLDGYLENYSKKFGLPLNISRLGASRLILSYFEDGRLPSRRHPLRYKATSYERLSATIRSYVDSYVAACGGGWSSSTSEQTRRQLSSFLLHIQVSGKDLAEVTEDVVWSYFYDSERDVALRGHGVSYTVRRFLLWVGGQPGGECLAHMLPMVPMMARVRKPFDCLTEEEDSRLLAYVLGDGCKLSLRDRAICVIARFCGLRACGIAALRMSDIDLSRRRFSIRQRKTGVPLEQSLRPVVGNAICRYVKEERPLSDAPELFLVNEREVRPLSPAAVGFVCDKAYRLAGVRRDGHRKGGHILRHRFAQCLIEGGACDAAAMRLLGHSSPSSLDVYLETDQARLRDCALSISDFAMGKEVLA